MMDWWGLEKRLRLILRSAYEAGINDPGICREALLQLDAALAVWTGRGQELSPYSSAYWDHEESERKEPRP